MVFGVPSSLSCSKEHGEATAQVHSLFHLTMINAPKAQFTPKPHTFPNPPRLPLFSLSICSATIAAQKLQRSAFHIPHVLLEPLFPWMDCCTSPPSRAERKRNKVTTKRWKTATERHKTTNTHNLAQNKERQKNPPKHQGDTKQSQRHNGTTKGDKTMQLRWLQSFRLS